MLSIRFTNDLVAKRIRWVMTIVMLFSMITGLAGQPPSFWRDPAMAIRFDGLSIHSLTNPTFDFFLGDGWQAYVAANVIYVSVAFLLVSLLPGKLASIAALSLIFSHFFAGSCWLAVRWHLGVEGAVVYSIFLGALLVVSGFPPVEFAGAIVSRLRWVMLAAMLLDYTVTLAGQPISFWRRPETMRESNQLARLFLLHGWPGYLLYAILLVSGMFLLLQVLPKGVAMIGVLATILGSFGGASNWFFYDWKMGIWTPAIYGIVLSIAIVSLALGASDHANRRGDMPNDQDENRFRRSVSQQLRSWCLGCR